MEFYRQTTEYTGAAAALLMALHRFDPETALSRDEEFSIWMSSCNLPTRSSSVFGLAAIAAERGVPARIVVEDGDYDYPDYRFKRYKKVEIEDASFANSLHEKRAEKAGVTVDRRTFTLDDVKGLLGEDKLLLLRINAGVVRDESPRSRYVLLSGYEGGQFTMLDPAQGELRIPEEQLQEAFDTLVEKKKRDRRMLVLG